MIKYLRNTQYNDDALYINLIDSQKALYDYMNKN